MYNPFKEGLEGFDTGSQPFIQNKLKMALISKQIELEAQARMQEMQKQHELGQVSGEQVGTLAKMMGANGDMSQLNSMTLPGSLAGAALSGIGMSNRIPAIGFEKTTNANGEEILVPVNRKTGQVGMSGQSIGMTTTAGHEVAAAGASYGTMHNTLEGVRARVANFLGAQNAAQIPTQYANLKLNQILQNNPEAKAYFDDLPATSLRIDKQLTGSSRFAANIVEATNHGLPQMTDTVQTAMQKLDNYDNLGKAAVNAVYDAYKVAPQDRNYGLPPSDLKRHFTAGFNAGAEAAQSTAKQQYLQSLQQQFGEQAQSGKGQ